MNIHQNGRTLDTMERLQQLLIALANPQRIEILLALTRGPTAVTPLADALELDMSAVSHGLRVLRDCGLATMQRDKIRHIYSATAAVRLTAGTEEGGPQLHVSCPLGTVMLEVCDRYAECPAPVKPPETPPVRSPETSSETSHARTVDGGAPSSR